MPTLIGTQGDDLLTGTAQSDIIIGDWGEDVIDGGDGDDTIIDSGGSNILRGGAGNDFIRLSTLGESSDWDNIERTNLIEGGDGDDVVSVELWGHNRLRVDLGSGSDLLTFNIGHFHPGNQIRVATGAGSDRIVLDRTTGDELRWSISPVPIVIEDFTAGADGDILDIAGLVRTLLAYSTYSANPFASGHLRLVQVGSDTVVRIDIDGYGSGSSEAYVRDIVRLSNVDASLLTSFNLAGFAPDGSALVRTTLTGTAASDWLHADAGGSNLSGLDGNDRLFGGEAHDVIDGGSGNDLLDGGWGNDVLRGGDGDDILTDPSGADTLDGGAGNDIIAIDRQAGSGNFGLVTILAGDGDDFVSFNSPEGATLVVDLGAGNDRFELPHRVDRAELTLGAGQDRVVIGQQYFRFAEPHSNPRLTIADFTPGDGGDVLEMDRQIGSGWDGLANPFATGHFRLQQSGADTLVIFDYSADGRWLLPVARLSNVDAASLTAFNFGGFAPNGSPSSYHVPSGTAGDDLLYGSNGSDVILGGAGNDRIEDRKAGSDTLSGGDGDDYILVRHSWGWNRTEVVTIDGGVGNDTVDVEMFGTGARLNVNLGAGDDRLVLWNLPQGGSIITLGAGADVVQFGSTVSISGTYPVTITDFTTGLGGDRLDWNLWASFKGRNGNGDYNPFLEGDARLVQSGSSTLLEFDGSAGSNLPRRYFTLVTFQNTTASSFNAYNLGFATYFPTLQGGADADVLIGTAAADIIHGHGGDDRLEGMDGDDVLLGQDGSDTLLGGAATTGWRAEPERTI